MARTLISADEYIIAENHPKYPDTKNRYGKELWESFLNQHYPSGGHTPPYNSFPIPETSTYEGASAAQTIDFLITTFTEILCLWIWSEQDGNLYLVTGDGMPKMKSTAEEAPQTDRVTAISTTGFTLGTAAEVNTSGVTYHYFVLGYGSTPDPGVNDDPPAWIQHGTPLQGGDETTSANSVEYDLDTKFQGGHTEAGAHLSGAFAGLAEAEQGSCTPTGSAAQEEALAAVTDAVKAVFLLPDAPKAPLFKFGVMPATRDFSNVSMAAASPDYLTLGTGKFLINGFAGPGEVTVFNLQSDTTDGSTTFTDSSGDPHAITAHGGVKHSTDTAHTGASSIKLTASTGMGSGGDYLEVVTALGSDLTPYGDFSLSFWVKTNGGYFANRGILQAFNLCVALDSASPYNAPKIKLTNVWNPAGGYILTTTTTMNDNAWHQVEILFSLGTLSILIDGSVEASGTMLSRYFWQPAYAPTGYAEKFYVGAGYTAVGTVLNAVEGVSSPDPVYLDDILYKVTNPEILPVESQYFVIGG
jgi:hypothetical protein